MAYESDPAGLGVGKRYGPLHLGGMEGKRKSYGSVDEYVFDITTEEIDGSGAQSFSVPPYSEVVAVWAKIDDAFGTGDVVAITLGGNAITAASIDVATAGIFDPALHATAANIQTGATAETLVIDTSGVDDGAIGAGRIIVEIRQL